MKKSLNFSLLLLMSLTLSCYHSFAQEQVFKVTDYGIQANQKTSIASQLKQVILDIKTKQRNNETAILKFDKGVYYFDAEDCLRKEVYISNHDQVGNRAIGMLFEGMHNIRIEGNGAEFICRGRMLPMMFFNCSNIELKNFSLDFDNPMMAQLEVIENNGNSLKFRPAPWVLWRIRNGKFNYYGKGWDYIPNTGVAFDQEKKSLIYRTADIGVSVDGVINNGDGTITAPNWRNEALVVGSQIAARTEDKQCPGIFLYKDKNIKLTGITIHYAQAMGLLAHACEDITLDNTSVKIKAESGRYFTTQYDATHFSSCKGKITIQNGLFEGMMDDAMNVHGLYLLINKRINNHTVEGRYPERQSWGFEWGLKEEKVQFVDCKTFDQIGNTYTIKSIKPKDKPNTLGAKIFTIEFEEDLPPFATNKKIGIENITRTPEVEYRNNIVRNNRARGILLNTPKHILIEGNTFEHVSGSAILVSTDCNRWYESGRTQDVLIRNNKFIDCLTTDRFQFCNAIISFAPIIPNLKSQKDFFYGKEDGVIIEENEFKTFDIPLLFAISTEGIIWRNNTVKETNTYPRYHPNHKRFKLDYCGKATIDGEIVKNQIEDHYTKTDEYPVWDEVEFPRQGTDRVIRSIQITGTTIKNEAQPFEVEVAGKEANSQDRIVFDKTSSTLNVNQGDKLTVKVKNNGFTWMHYYLYIDYNQNKKFEESELVSYTAFQSAEDIELNIFRNSLGQRVNPGKVPESMPVFTIPNTTPLGKTRVRFKVDWNSKEPRGSAEPADPIDKNRGTICDFTIDIHSDNASAVEMQKTTPLKVYIQNKQLIIKGANSKTTAFLYNISGELIKSFEITGPEFIKDVDLPTGIYLLKAGNQSMKLEFF